MKPLEINLLKSTSVTCGIRISGNNLQKSRKGRREIERESTVFCTSTTTSLRNVVLITASAARPGSMLAKYLGRVKLL